MPGIVGIITKKPADWAGNVVRSMTEVLRHKTSYVQGYWASSALNVYVGWMERSASFSSSMPLENESGRKILCFSGEEYANPQIHQQLTSRGHVLGTNRAEYLVHVAEEDQQFPRSLNGKFHGVLADKDTETVLLFNDRFGMHRLYYYETPDCFYFAGEAKAILAVCPELRAADERGVGEYISFGCVLEDRTIFRELKILPSGSAWRFKNGALQTRAKYFDAKEWEDQPTQSAADYYEQLREVFTSNLRRYLNDPEKVAISLTGGLDTRMIMAWAGASDKVLPGYTFGGPYRECEDVKIARKVAKICSQPYEVIPVSGDFLSKFADYAERSVYLSDGCAAVTRAADLYANEFAAQIAPIRVTGNYGSEVLRHLRAFKPTQPNSEIFTPEVLKSIATAKETFERQIDCHAVTFAAFRQAPWYQYGLLSLEETQLAVRSPFLDNDVVQVAFRAPNSEIVKSDLFEDNAACSRLIHDGSRELYKIPTDRGLGGENRWLAPALRAVLEFTFKAEYAYDYGMPQWLARIDSSLSWMKLERLFLGRHKFCHYRVWYRDALGQYVKEMLLDSRSLSRPYLKRTNVESIVQHHLRGTHNYTTEITKLLTLELQHRLFLDPQ